MKPAKKILMIDDDSNLRGLARAYFKKEEFVFSEAASGPLGLESARLQKPDIIIIDMMMQEMSGIEVKKPFVFDELRAIIDSILVRSARSEKAP